MRLMENKALIVNIMGLYIALVGYTLPWFICAGSERGISGFMLIVIYHKVVPLLALILIVSASIVLLLGDILRKMPRFSAVLSSLLGLSAAILVEVCRVTVYPPLLCIFINGAGFLVTKIGALLQFVAGMIPFFSESTEKVEKQK